MKLNDPKVKWAKGKKEKIIALRGLGTPENPDVMYGSMAEVALEKETIVGLQDKLLYALAVLQGADARPSTPIMQAVDILISNEGEMVNRWKVLNR